MSFVSSSVMNAPHEKPEVNGLNRNPPLPLLFME
jgi:hypothetical protein